MTMDLSRNLISIDGKFVPLTQKEYQIVHLLCMRKGAVLSKESFIAHIYGGIDEPDSKIIDVFVCKLRRKLEKSGLKSARIDTVWGQGYVLRVSYATSWVLNPFVIFQIMKRIRRG